MQVKVNNPEQIDDAMKNTMSGRHITGSVPQPLSDTSALPPMHPSHTLVGNKPVVIVDLDGVVYDWANSFNNVWTQANAHIIGVSRVDWMSKSSHLDHMTDDEYHRFDIKHVNEIYGSGMLAEFGIVPLLHRLHDLCRIVFMTARPIEAEPVTQAFIDSIMQGRPYVLHFAKDKRAASAYTPMFAIDDSPSHISEFLTLPSINTAALRTQPWNRDNNSVLFGDESGGRSLRVNWMSEFVDHVEDVLSFHAEWEMSLPLVQPAYSEVDETLVNIIDPANPSAYNPISVDEALNRLLTEAEFDWSDDPANAEIDAQIEAEAPLVEDLDEVGNYRRSWRTVGAQELRSLAKHSPEGLPLVSDAVRFHAGRSDLLDTLSRCIDNVSGMVPREDDNDWWIVLRLSPETAIEFMSVRFDSDW